MRPGRSTGPALGAGGILLLGLLAGLVTGLGEAGVQFVRARTSGPDPLVSSHYFWMIPVAMVALFLVIALPLALSSLALRRRLPALLVLAALLTVIVLVPLTTIPELHSLAMLAVALGIGVQGGRLLAPRTARLLTAAGRWTPALAVVVVVVGAAGVGREWVRQYAALSALPAAPRGAPNVLLIILDTVRAASVSLYGNRQPTTPDLEQLAEGGVVFDQAWSTSPWTLPSHGSLFTGRYPFELTADLETALDDAFPTLAEHFAGHGYATVGLSGNIRYANRAMGVARGFIHYEDYPLEPATILQSAQLTRRIARAILRAVGNDEKLVRKSARSITDRFLEWHDAAPERPFFAFLNYYDAHAPYLPPDSLADRFGPRRTGRALHELSRREVWDPQDIERERSAYEASLSSIDQQLGRLFDALEARGIDDNTLVVVTSDHGEQFGEHGLMDHGNSLYRPVLEVPLVIRYPDSVPAGLRIRGAVSLRDVAATIADLADVEPAPFPGTSLASLWSGQPAAVSRPYAELRAGIRTVPWVPLAKGRMVSVVVDGFHLIENGDGSTELFDLSNDPDELINLADSSGAARVLGRARSRLGAIENAHRGRPRKGAESP